MSSCEHKTIQLISTEQAIEQFMVFFRESFPKATVLNYAIPQANSTHIGFGLLGEQGAESIHAKFTRLGLAYTAVTDKVKHLLCIVKEHFVIISAELQGGPPPVTLHL